MDAHPKLKLVEAEFYERQICLRMPFRFGVVTMTEAPQVFARARIRLDDGREGWGWAAELLAPKWFDKSPHLTNDDNFQQLRRALAIAADTYLQQPASQTAFGLHAASASEHGKGCADAGLPGLVAGFGVAVLDRAILDALLRLESASVFAGAKANLFALDASTASDLAGWDFDSFLKDLAPASTIAVRHTVGLVDPLTANDIAAGERRNDGLPETLDEVIGAYGVTHFKLKLCGDQDGDVDRLFRIAAILDRLPSYRATLDGNEQYADAESVVALWRRIHGTPQLARLADAVLCIEQPIGRSVALATDISALARLKPVEIDEFDSNDGAFVQAKPLGYTGVSSKSCKGFYRSLLNRARVEKWNREAGRGLYFMSAEDLTTQAGLSLQQDLALATLIGCSHVERNGHHYVNGMAAVPEAEQDAFLARHPDLYVREAGAVRVGIRDGRLAIGSLKTPGLGSAAVPDPGSLHRTGSHARSM